MLALGISHSPKLLVAWPVLLGVGIMFSSIALIFNALAKGTTFSRTTSRWCSRP